MSKKVMVAFRKTNAAITSNKSRREYLNRVIINLSEQVAELDLISIDLVDTRNRQAFILMNCLSYRRFCKLMGYR